MFRVLIKLCDNEDWRNGDRIRSDCRFNLDRRGRDHAERRLQPHFYLHYGR
jgi:hypothetical protein